MTTYKQQTDLELEIDAKHEVERFKRYNSTLSTEEILLDMAKSYVYLQKKYNKQENFFLAVFGSTTIGSLLSGVIGLFSGDWKTLFWSVTILVASVAIAIYVYGEKRNKQN